ncbi:MAG: hypothetical protein PWP24_787 [Clostridiales bacterium]|nr:hypothetical protein [Clostridiales bacterium]
MFRCKKGEYGYIKKKKMQQLTLAILMGVIGLLIYGIGYYLNGFERNNVCLVLGILMVLPGAKFMTTFILLFPYHSFEKSFYNSITVDDNALLLSDVVITSTERAMHLDFLYIGNGCVLGLLVNHNKGGKPVQDYLTKGVRNYADDYTVKITESKESFQKSLHNITKKDVEKEIEDKVIAYLYSLMV